MMGEAEQFYAQELKRAIDEYRKVSQDIDRLEREKKATLQMLRHLLALLRVSIGDSAARAMLAEAGLEHLAGAPTQARKPRAPRPPRSEEAAPAARATRRRAARPAKIARAPKAPKPPAPKRNTEELRKQLPPTCLERGTPVKMLTGIYGGYSGKVTSVQPRLTRGSVDALYVLSLVSTEGKRARTTVKQSSLGRSWVKLPA